MRFVAFVLALALLLPVPAQAHDRAELREWRHHWTLDVQADGGLTRSHVAEWRRMARRHGCAWPGTVCRVRAPIRYAQPVEDAVERWRPLLVPHFGANTDAALRIIACESGGNAYAANPRSSARGLFQMIGGWWTGAWSYPAFDPYDPAANIAAAAWLSKGGTDWSAWVCRP